MSQIPEQGWNNWNKGLEGHEDPLTIWQPPPFCTWTSFTFTNFLPKAGSMATSQSSLGSAYFLLQAELSHLRVSKALILHLNFPVVLCEIPLHLC